MKEKNNGGGVTLATVKSSVLLVGQRLAYGVSNADADVLEDESASCLWCWEVKFSRSFSFLSIVIFFFLIVFNLRLFFPLTVFIGIIAFASFFRLIPEA